MKEKIKDFFLKHKNLCIIIKLLLLFLVILGSCSLGYDLGGQYNNSSQIEEKQANRRNASYNDFSGFENIDAVAVVDDDGPFALLTEEITIAPSYNFSDIVGTMNDYYVENNLESDYYLIELTNFIPFTARLIGFTFTGFYRLDYILTTNEVLPYEVGNINAFNTGLFPDIGTVKFIKLYATPTYLELPTNGYQLTLTYQSDYQIGYNEGYNAGYDRGVQVGVNQVVQYPNNFQLYTQQQLQQAVQDAINDTTNPLRNIWPIIRNGADAVSAVLEIQILPGLPISGIIGIFIGVPLLLWAFKALAA